RLERRSDRMSYRDIQVYFSHFARDAAGIAGLTVSYDVEAAFPLDNLIDDRQTTKMKFDSAESDHWIDIDMGAGFDGLIDTIIIPAGHSLDGIDLDLLGDTTHAPTTSRASFTPSGDGIIKETVSDEDTVFRYWRLEFDTLGAHELHGVILTFKKTFTVGFDMPGADDSPVNSFQRFEQPSGITPTLNLGLPRRKMTQDFKHALAGTDLATMEEWIAIGMHRPAYIDPPSFSATPDVDDPATLFYFATDPRRAWGTAVPNTETEKKFFTLDLIESVG
ncbi:MAG: hypothetical protein KAJ19_09530, partial [Gammaproteobacteria bacterium]|nr:hypothetical protein [Gammaproteobacteria bacterium]